MVPIAAPRAGKAAPVLLVVSEAPEVRLAVAREVGLGCRMVTALGATSADRRLDLGVAVDGLVLDLDADRRVVSDFLCRLVDRAFHGPRILLSSGFRPEASATVPTGCHTHFALGRPWRAGELRSLLERVLGVSHLAQSASRP
ncbi:hypothetical protein KH5H1_19640 [Corallococcus caeni]|uniref:hypothetical protein n=1 Tax=Corallococcus caeni TaxID=3082388 RepID=UPI002955F0A2|nr:hypothetical protein KH5H1_19640 [Corallococcus sp. KH5-1]